MSLVRASISTTPAINSKNNTSWPNKHILLSTSQTRLSRIKDDKKNDEQEAGQEEIMSVPKL